MFFAVVRLRLTGSQQSEISGDGVVVGVVLAVAFETTELVAVSVVSRRRWCASSYHDGTRESLSPDWPGKYAFAQLLTLVYTTDN
jgi:hypothetical protein